MKLDKIVFYHPSQITGGTEYLFLRCAEYLAENQKSYAIFIVDYDDGFYRRNVKTGKIHFIEYNSQYKTQISDGSCVVVQLNCIGHLFNMFKYNEKESIFLFWALHFKNLSSFVYFEKLGIYIISPWERKKLGKEITELASKNVIKFMGPTAYVAITKDFYQKPKFFSWLPNIAPQNLAEIEPSYNRLSKSLVKFCWLGRLDSEKALNIITYMNELEYMCSSIKLSLSLIGTGPEESHLKEIASKYHFQIVFAGEKRDKDLDEYIRTQSEIGLASGTSALEFALRGKPVIYEGLLDRVYAAGERKKYFLLCDLHDVSYDSNCQVYRKGEADFETKVRQILGNYTLLSKKSYDFVKQYTAENCGLKLIANIENIGKENCETLFAHICNVNKMLNRGKRRKMFIKTIFGFFND